MLSQDVRLFVRLSLTRRYCVEMGKHIIIFSSSVATRRFRSERFGTIPTGTPAKGKSSALQRVLKIAIFNQYLAFYRK